MQLSHMSDFLEIYRRGGVHRGFGAQRVRGRRVCRKKIVIQ